MSSVSNLDREVWNEFYGHFEHLCDYFESEPEPEYQMPSMPSDEDETEVWQRVKSRKHQQFFRQMIMAAYDGRCCITGISKNELVNAAHIRRWADDPVNRLNPSNGLALNALHDRAFETGLIGITKDYRVKVSSELIKAEKRAPELSFLLKFADREINLPERFLPDQRFLEEHFDTRFRK